MNNTVTDYKSSFDELGYAVIESALPIEAFDKVKTILENIVNVAIQKFLSAEQKNDIKNLSDLDSKLVFLNSINPRIITFIQRTISRSPEFFNLSGSPIISQWMRTFLSLEENSPLYLLSNGIIFTIPRETIKRSTSFDIGWHKDIFFTIPESRFLHVWIPLLHDATKEIGTLKVCPGSHKAGVGKQIYDPTATFNYTFMMDPEEVKKYNPVSVEVKRGDALIFDARLIHASGENTSEHIRCTMLGIYHDISSEAFYPVQTTYKYHHKTPEQYFYELYGDEKIKPFVNDQLAEAGEPKGGV